MAKSRPNDQPFNPQLRTIYLLFGCFGSGKTWISSRLTELFHVVDYDTCRKTHLEVLRAAPKDKPILFICPIKVSTFIRRNGSEFNIFPIGIVESLEVIKERIISRGGEFTPTVTKRMARVDSLVKNYAKFYGTSNECLEYLKNVKYHI